MVYSHISTGKLAYAVDPIVQRQEGLRSNTEKLALALRNVFDNLCSIILVPDLLARFAKFMLSLFLACSVFFKAEFVHNVNDF